ncbi:TAF8 (predicted) [Pycnogonum litorale]
MATSESSNNNSYRNVIMHSVALACHESGFSNIEKGVVETLTEMLISCMVELGRTSRNYCELSGRTQPGVGDVVMALIDTGFKLDNLHTYAKRNGMSVAPSPGLQLPVSKQKLLSVGDKKKHPNYIPEDMPVFPDPHTYIRTPTHKQPVTEYEAIREKAASQKKDVERALTRFIAKTGDTDSLFVDEASCSQFPIIATKTEQQSYLHALIPKDQVFEEEEPPRKERKPKRQKKVEESGEENEEDDDVQKSENSETEIIDNPYLRPCKIPRKVK